MRQREVRPVEVRPTEKVEEAKRPVPQPAIKKPIQKKQDSDEDPEVTKAKAKQAKEAKIAALKARFAERK